MQAQAVEQLGFVGRHLCGQACSFLGIGIGAAGSDRRRHELIHRHALQHQAHFFQCGRGAQAIQAQAVNRLQHGLAVAEGQRFNQAKYTGAVYAAQHQAHSGLAQCASAEGNRLIGQAERIAHGAARGAGQQAQRLLVGADVFGLQHLGQVRQHRLWGHGAQVELQAA